MERVLQKIATQLAAYDEASFLALWERYATIVDNFEPTKRWEEAALIFSIIQAVHWKNQLFNYNLSQSRNPDNLHTELPLFPLLSPPKGADAHSPENPSTGRKQRCKVLRFRPPQSNEPI